jgi:hypothetical protein
MVNKKTWKGFREAGLLWFINQILHLFGWAIVMEIDKEGNVTDCYPARVEFRGFSEKDNTEGYIKLTEHLKSIIDDLEKESKG